MALEANMILKLFEWRRSLREVTLQRDELAAMINHDLSDSRVPLRTSQLYEPALLIYL